MATYVLAAFLVDDDDPEVARGIVRNSTAFDCVGASPRIRDGRIFAVASEEEYLGAKPPPDFSDQAAEIAHWFTTKEVVSEYLDEAIHGEKGREGSAVNNADLAEQVEYLLGRNWSEHDICVAVMGEASHIDLVVECGSCRRATSKRVAEVKGKGPGVRRWQCPDCDDNSGA